MGQKSGGNVHHVIIHEAPSNVCGVAGFVLSLLGFVSCGILGLPGVFFSFLGMFKKPRGLAVAGFVIGLFVSLGWLVVLSAIGMGSVLAVFGIEPEGTTAQKAYQEHPSPWQPDGTQLPWGKKSSEGTQPPEDAQSPKSDTEQRAQIEFERAAEISRNGRYDLSANILRSIISEYPETTAAEKAKQILPGVEKRAREKGQVNP